MKIKIFIDMDGVLVDFDGGMKKVATPTLVRLETQLEIAENKLRRALPTEFSNFERENAGKVEAGEMARKLVKSLKGTPNWELPEVKAYRKADNAARGVKYSLMHNGYFLGLDPMPDMMELVSFVRKIDSNPSVLTAPIAGKPEQVKECCDEKREWIRQHLPGMIGEVICEESKSIYATPEPDTMKILIDDRSKNTIPWENAGGVAVLHTSAANTIAKLKELLHMNEALKTFVKEVVENELKDMLVKFGGKQSIDGTVEPLRETPVSYTGIVLTNESRSKLLQAVPVPEGWEKVAHHMTLNMGPWKGDKDKVGAPFKLRAMTIAHDDKVIAVGVETPLETTNKIPHITVAVNRAAGGKPVMSNKLTTWKLLAEPIELEGTLQEV